MHGGTRSPVGTVALSANCAWNLAHFRRPIIQKLIGLGWRVVAMVPQDEFTTDLEALGMEVHPVAMNPRGLSPLADLALLFRYYRALRKVNPTVFMAFTAKPNIYGSAAAAWAGIPCLNTVSGLGTGFLSGRLLEAILTKLYRWGLRRTYRVFFHNADDRNLFLLKKIVRPEQAVIVNGSGVSLSRFSPASSSPQRASPTFLFIGRFLKDKGVHEFLQAAAAVKKTIAANYQMIGSLDSHPKAACAKALKLSAELGYVELVGENTDVRPFIAAADCIVLPSYREGLPRVLLEAAAMGKPVIATNVAGCRDVVEDGVTGLLCEPKSSQSLAGAMLSFAAMPENDRQAMGRRARDKAEREFSEDSFVDAYVDVIAQLAAAMSQPETRRAAV